MYYCIAILDYDSINSLKLGLVSIAIGIIVWNQWYPAAILIANPAISAAIEKSRFLVETSEYILYNLKMILDCKFDAQKPRPKECWIVCIVTQAPQCYWEYMTFTGGYHLNGKKESLLDIPVLAPPSTICEQMRQLFTLQEQKRVRMRVRHAIEREKLILACEQEIMRVHGRAARTVHNQQVCKREDARTTMFTHNRRTAPQFH